MSVIGNPLSCGRGYDDNLIASNIKKGVSIYNVVGTFEGWVPGDKEIYKYGAWGDGYSASQYVRCTDLSQYARASYSNSFGSNYISTTVDGGSYAGYMGVIYWGINKQFRFADYSRLKIELGGGTGASGIWVLLSSMWRTNWAYNEPAPYGMTLLTNYVSIQAGTTSTIDISSIYQDGYIYFSNSSGTAYIRRIYFE